MSNWNGLGIGVESNNNRVTPVTGNELDIELSVVPNISFSPFSVNIYRSSTERKSPAGNVIDDTEGTVEWLNIGSAIVKDGVYASAEFTQWSISEKTKFIDYYDFGFSVFDIPDGYMLSGIGGSIGAYASFKDDDTYSIFNVKPIIGLGIQDYYFSINDQYVYTDYRTINFGGPTDKAGMELTANDIMDINFGVALIFENYDDGGRTNSVFVDFLDLIAYIEPV